MAAKPTKIAAVRGMKDLLPPESDLWRFMEEAARLTFGTYGYREIRTPVLERTELFARAMGATTDVVQKEMYTFTDRAGDSLTLRPEATAGVCRAFIEQGLYSQGQFKFFTLGPMFRHERPQKGRFRQFTQFNVEALGFAEPMIDAEQIVMLAQLLDRLGVANVEIHLNSLGDDQCRPQYKAALIVYLEQHGARLCDDCRRRMRENPLRVLDCKAEGCKQIAEQAPTISAHWCDDCRAHFEEVQEFLEAAGVKYTVDPRLVRGLDYYTRTTFEALAGDLGAQNAVAGGGRYDNLIKELGGPDTPATGFAVGVDRLSLLIDAKRFGQSGPDLFFVAVGPQARRRAFAEVVVLREGGLWVEMSSADTGLNSQLKRANKLGAARVVFRMEDELDRGVITFKDMDTGHQEEVLAPSLGSMKNLDPVLWSNAYCAEMVLMRSLFDDAVNDPSAFEQKAKRLDNPMGKRMKIDHQD
ncbi:MAG: histidine--tRNA ligase [Proteobacteria bacterium]|nr:histidine--tRNA ligase [Pseudomonadota bacterium]